MHGIIRNCANCNPQNESFIIDFIENGISQVSYLIIDFFITGDRSYMCALSPLISTIIFLVFTGKLQVEQYSANITWMIKRKYKGKANFTC